MRRPIVFVLIAWLLTVMAGCLFSDSKNGGSSGGRDRGSYSLAVSQTSCVTYPGGGGIFLIQLLPDSLFAGDVRLNLTAAPELNAELYRESIDRDKPVSEIVVKPDSTMAMGDYALNLSHAHGDTSAAVEFTVKLDEGDYRGLYPRGHLTDILPEEFLVWMVENYPELEIEDEDSWYRYCNRPYNSWTYVSTEWHLGTIWYLSLPSRTKHFMLRRRGDYKRMVVLESDKYTALHKIPIERYGVLDWEDEK